MRHRTMAGLSLAIATIISGAVGAAAQDATPTPGQDCVGTWLLRVTALGQPESTGFPVNATFGADGSFITEGAPVSAGPPDAPENVTVASTAQGVWEPTESGACAVNHVFYNSDLGGNLVNTVEISDRLHGRAGREHDDQRWTRLRDGHRGRRDSALQWSWQYGRGHTVRPPTAPGDLAQPDARGVTRKLTRADEVREPEPPEAHKKRRATTEADPTSEAGMTVDVA